MEAVLGYKLQKESNCPILFGQYLLKSDTTKDFNFVGQV